VTSLILLQASELLQVSLFELTDHSLSTDTLDSISHLVAEVLSSTKTLFASSRITDIRGIRRGAHLYIDVLLDVDEGNFSFGITEMVRLEEAIGKRVRAAMKEVKDIRLRYTPVSL
jgi:divalent metal cation (Fe/Co/Zn/Cd) transporter